MLKNNEFGFLSYDARKKSLKKIEKSRSKIWWIEINSVPLHRI